jgi:hypothetical protein
MRFACTTLLDSFFLFCFVLLVDLAITRPVAHSCPNPFLSRASAPFSVSLCLGTWHVVLCPHPLRVLWCAKDRIAVINNDCRHLNLAVALFEKAVENKSRPFFFGI